MKQKLFSLLLMAFIPMAMMAYDCLVDGIYYQISTTEAYVVYKSSTNYNSYSGDVVIPESIQYNGKTYPVTLIGHDAFRGCTNLTSVTIPSSVTKISYNAFYGCTSLRTVNITEGVTEIGDRAFENCSSLKSFVIPNGVTSIGTDAFDACIALESLTIPNSLTSIGNFAFSQVGKKTDPCLLYAPDDYGFKNKAYFHEDYFEWYSGYFLVATEAISITISEFGVGTYCPLYDLDFSNVTDFKAYVAMGYNKSTGNVTVVEVKDVPRRTGIFLKGTPGTYSVPTGYSNTYYVNMLKGVTVATNINATDGSMTNFILYNGTNGIGFYTFNNSYTVGANKAYLQIPTSMVSSSSSANYFGIEFEEGVTGIDNMHSATEQAEWYSLDGRRLNSKPTQKGVYIVNGMKVVVK